MRALPPAVTLTDQARARKHDTDLGNRLADRAFGLLGRDAVLTVIRSRNAGKLPDCGTPAREQVTGLTEAGDAGIGTVILIRSADTAHSAGFGDGAGIVIRLPGPVLIGGRAAAIGAAGARGWVMAWPAAGYGVVAAGGQRGEEDEQA